MAPIDEVEDLRRWILAAPARGAIVEEDREIPAQGYLPPGILTNLPRAVRRRWASAEPGVSIHPNFHGALPPSFVDLIRRYGSVHWVAPPTYDGALAFPFNNTGPDVFFALSWPVHFDAAELVAALGEDIDEAVEEFTVVHDGFKNGGAAFDGRIRDAAGRLLMVEGFDSNTVVRRIRTPRPEESTRTFDVWLRDHIARVKAELLRNG